MADLATLTKNSLYGSGSLTSSSRRDTAIMSNISAASGIASNSAAQQNLLKQAQAAMTAKKYQDAAKYLWWILGSPGTMPQAYTAQQVAAAAAAASKNSNAPATVKAAVASAVVAQQQTATPQQTASATVVAGINKVWDGLHAGNVNRDAVQYNLNLLRTKGGLSSAQNNLLSRAYQQVGNGSYQQAAETMWVLMGSPASRTPHVAQATASYNAAQTALKASQNIDPQKMAGYTFKYSLSHAEQNAYLNAKSRNAKLTEYEWRKANGKDIATATGKYVAPKYTYSSEKSQKNTASVGSGDKKIEASKSSVNSNATAKKTAKAQIKAVDHTGQIQLKDGTWIDQVQKSGSKGTGSAKIYSSKQAYTDAVAAQKRANKEAQAVRKAYSETVGKNGQIIDAVQAQGQKNTGESAVTVFKVNKATGKITSRSGTAGEYKQSIKNAQALGEWAEKSVKSGKVLQSSDILALEKAQKYLTDRGQSLASFGFVNTLLKSSKTTSDTPKNVMKTGTVEAKVAKALYEARKINPNGSVEYFAGVENSVRRNEQNSWDLLNEDTAKALAPIFSEVDKVAGIVSKQLGETKMTFTDKGKVIISEDTTGASKVVSQSFNKSTPDQVTFNTKEALKEGIRSNEVLAGGAQFVLDEYNTMRTRPYDYGLEAAAMYVSGAAFGAGVAGLKTATKFGASKVAAKVGSKALSKAVTAAGEYGVDATLLLGFGNSLRTSRSEFYNDPDYLAMTPEQQALAKVSYYESFFKMGKEFAIGNEGFKVGVKGTNSLITGVKSARAAKVAAKVEPVQNDLPSDWDITNVAKFAEKPVQKITSATDRKITALETRIEKLKKSSSEEAKTEIKQLKQQVNAIKSAAVNEKAKISFDKETYAGVKELAEIKAFDKELAQLRELKAFADDYAGSVLKPQITANQAEIALQKLSREELTIVDDIKRGATRREIFEEAHTKANLRERAKQALKSKKISDLRQETPEHKAANTRIKKERAAKLKSKKSLAEEKLKSGSAELRKKALQLQAEASRIQKGLEKARIETNVKQEAIYTAKAAKFKIKTGLSVKEAALKASLTKLRNAITEKTSTSSSKVPKVDEYSLKKGISEAVSSYNEKVSPKSLSQKAFDRELSRLKDADFDAKLESLKADAAFDVELAELRKIKDFAEIWMNPYQRTVKTVKTGYKPEVVEKTLGQKRAEFEARRAARETFRKSKKANSSTPSKDITDVKTWREYYESTPEGKNKLNEEIRKEYRKLLKASKAKKAYETDVKDITDVVLRRKSGKGSSKLNLLEIAEARAKAKLGFNSRTDWQQLKELAVKDRQAAFERNMKQQDKYSQQFEAREAAKNEKYLEEEFKSINTELEKIMNVKSIVEIRSDDMLVNRRELWGKVKTADQIKQAWKDAAVRRVEKASSSTVTSGSRTTEAKPDNVKKAIERSKKRTEEVRKSYKSSSSSTVDSTSKNGSLQMLQKVETAVKNLEKLEKREISKSEQRIMKKRVKSKDVEAKVEIVPKKRVASDRTYYYTTGKVSTDSGDPYERMMYPINAPAGLKSMYGTDISKDTAKWIRDMSNKFSKLDVMTKKPDILNPTKSTVKQDKINPPGSKLKPAIAISNDVVIKPDTQIKTPVQNDIISDVLVDVIQDIDTINDVVVIPIIAVPQKQKGIVLPRVLIDTPYMPNPKKKAKRKEFVKKTMNKAFFQRKLKNRLGNLASFFGDSEPERKSPKKSKVKSSKKRSNSKVRSIGSL